jgi:hypothetical protein
MNLEGDKNRIYCEVTQSHIHDWALKKRDQLNPVMNSMLASNYNKYLLLFS